MSTHPWYVHYKYRDGNDGDCYRTVTEIVCGCPNDAIASDLPMAFTVISAILRKYNVRLLITLP